MCTDIIEQRACHIESFRVWAQYIMTPADIERAINASSEDDIPDIIEGLRNSMYHPDAELSHMWLNHVLEDNMTIALMNIAI